MVARASFPADHHADQAEAYVIQSNFAMNEAAPFDFGHIDDPLDRIISLTPAEASISGNAPEWSPTVLRFFDYLTAIPIDRAFRILGLWTTGDCFEEFAATIVSKIPSNWFSATHYAPLGPRLVFANGRLSLAQILQTPDKPPLVVPFHDIPKSQIPPPRPPTKRRALNSFMAFRSKSTHKNYISSLLILSGYFSGVFPGLRQSLKSSLLSEIWTDDPLKSHWSLMARAYTLIRDNFRMEDSTVPLFIRLVSDFMGIPDPRNYLLLCGFTVYEQVWPERKYELTGPDYERRITPHVRTTTIAEIVEFLLQSPHYQMEQYPESTWPYEIAPHENGQMAITLDLNHAIVDDPLVGLFDESKNWDFDIEDTYSVVDSSISADRDIVVWPACDLEDIARTDAEYDSAYQEYRERRDAGLIFGVPPMMVESSS